MSWTGRGIGNRARWSLLRPVCLGLAVAATACGCKSRSDLVEAELRTRDSEIRELRTALQRSEMLNSALTQPTAIVGPPPFAPPPHWPGEHIAAPVAVMSGTVKEVTLGRGTGGVDQDGIPGDEALLLIVVPKDTDGSALKVPGNLVVQTYEFTAEGQKLPASRWDIPSLDLQKLWKSGLLSTGYHVTLPWKTWPVSPKLRVVAQFTTLADNRTFEAERDVTINLMPGVARPSIIIPGPIMPAPEDGPVLSPGARLRQRDPAAWLNEIRPNSPPTTSAKPGEREPAKLLEPQPAPDE